MRETRNAQAVQLIAIKHEIGKELTMMSGIADNRTALIGWHLTDS